MPQLHVRKLVTQVEEIHSEMGQPLAQPSRKAIAAAVITNPYAGRFEQDLSPLYDLGAEVGEILAQRALQALGVAPEEVQAYGKGAIVGLDGEIEHAAAILHPKFGAPVRAVVHHGNDIIPGTKKMGGAGSLIVMPVTNKDDIWQFDDMDAAEIAIGDAPRADEMLIALVLATGGRPLHRVGKPA